MKEGLSFEPNLDLLAPAVRELYSNKCVGNCHQLSQLIQVRAGAMFHYDNPVITKIELSVCMQNIPKDTTTTATTNATATTTTMPINMSTANHQHALASYRHARRHLRRGGPTDQPIDR